MLFKYIAKLYAKHLFFILLALVSFFVFFDYILNVKKLPDATNLQLLYVSYKAMEALDILWQLSVVFAFITSWISMVKSNALVSFYSLGYKKRAVMLPFIAVFFLLYLFIIGLQMTDFSYAKDRAKQIRSNGALGSVTTNIFFKYNNDYVYMQKLLPLQKRAENIRIFEDLDGMNIRVVDAKVAYFKDDRWLLPNVEITSVKDMKVVTQKLQNYVTLKQFKPKVLETVYESGTGFTIIDAFNAVELFFSQGIKTDKIRAVLFNKLLTPFFSLLLILIYFNRLPLHARFSNLAVTTTIFTTFTLILWGLLFAFYRVTVTGVIPPEVGIVMPLVVLAALLLFFERKSIKSSAKNSL